MIGWDMWIVLVMVGFTIFMFSVYLVFNIFSEFHNKFFRNSMLK